MIQKPPHGAPCNNCGLCCMDQICPLGALVFGEQDGPCPALVPARPGHTCGLVVKPLEYVTSTASGPDLSKAAALLIGAGIGCDAQIEGEPPNEEFRDMVRMMARLSPLEGAVKAWRQSSPRTDRADASR